MGIFVFKRHHFRTPGKMKRRERRMKTEIVQVIEERCKYIKVRETRRT